MRGIARQIVLTSAVIMAGFYAAHPTRAVSCGTTGATLKVVVNNPTGSSVSSGTVTISGSIVNGQITCTDAASSYSATKTINTTPTEFFFDDLNSGAWVHKITVNDGAGHEYVQFQKGIVLNAAIDPNDPNSPADLDFPFSEASWTYFSHAIKVNETGDVTNGTCVLDDCTFREAINTVNLLSTSASSRALIYFTVSPGEMDPSLPQEIQLTKPYVTIDGTHSSGQPWIVGDTLGSQESFLRSIDLVNNHWIKIAASADYVTIKGLELTNTVESGTPQDSLLVDLGEGTRIEATRLDGGAGGVPSCGFGICGTFGLAQLSGADATFVNVEAKSGYGSAISSTSGGVPTILDSWLHHNLMDALDTSSGAVSRSRIELSGYNAANTQVGSASGMGHNGLNSLTELVTNGNIIRNNAIYGIEADDLAGGTISLNHDYICGNGSGGALIDLFASTSNAFGTGLTAAYNGGFGVQFTGFMGGDATFDNDSAFTANNGAGLVNGSNGNISAEGNQWRDVAGTSCTGSSDISGSSVDCDPAQNWADVAIALDATAPVFPSNVILAGQTIRLQGTGFNAIDGNPLDDPNDPNDPDFPTCTTGASASTENCCRKDRVNECDFSDPNEPTGVAGRGNCVALRDSHGVWNEASPAAVTPSMLTTGLPGNVNCIGEQSEMVRVVKLNSMGFPVLDEAFFCINKNPK